MSELIYILWLAVGTTGFWESVEGIQRIRELKRFPAWAWPLLAGLVPVFWISLIQVYFYPLNLFAYGIIAIVYLGILGHQKKSMWYGVPLLVLQIVLFIALPAWHFQADRFFVILLVELLALGLYVIKLSPVWAVAGIGLWIAIKPIFFSAHGQFNDLIDLIGLFLPLYLYMKENARRLRIVFERDHDPLTGLLNRTSFNDWLLEVKGSQGALMIVDLDDFKYVNDTFGHQAGDQILVEMGKRITRAIPKEAKVFRWGGDEFVIVCPGLENLQLAETVAQAIHLQVTPGSAKLGATTGCQASMGIAFGTLDDDLFNKADIALLHVKQSGKNRMGWYQDSLENLEPFKEFSLDFEKVAVQQRDLRVANAVWENVNDGVMITDLDGIILRVNRAFTRVTGYASEEVVGKNPSLLQSGVHPEEFYVEMWQEILVRGLWQGKITNRKKSGEIYEEWMQIRVIKDDAGVPMYYLSTFTDLAQFKALETEICQPCQQTEWQ